MINCNSGIVRARDFKQAQKKTTQPIICMHGSRPGCYASYKLVVSVDSSGRSRGGSLGSDEPPLLHTALKVKLVKGFQISTLHLEVWLLGNTDY